MLSGRSLFDDFEDPGNDLVFNDKAMDLNNIKTD